MRKTRNFPSIRYAIAAAFIAFTAALLKPSSRSVVLLPCFAFFHHLVSSADTFFECNLYLNSHVHTNILL